MPMCPLCIKPIEHLVAGFSKLEDFRFELDELGAPSYIITGDLPGLEIDGFSCPACGDELFKVEEEAIDFLKGG